MMRGEWAAAAETLLAAAAVEAAAEVSAEPVEALREAAVDTAVVD